ncbi:hypothetical protein [Pilimelia anulata]|nr:hypothetical protein [Pilimelia anulata]
MITGIALAGLGTALLAAPAAAAGTRHCVTDGTDLTCYADFRTALTAATAGRIADAPSGAHAAAADDGLVARLDKLGRDRAAARIVVGISFAGEDFSGSSLTHTRGFACDDPTSPVEHVLNVMPDGWNDEVESFRTYANCWARYYEHSNRTGSRYGYVEQAAELPDWLDDEVSSIEWS